MKTLPRYFWIVVFAPFALAALWFSWPAYRELYTYSVLTAHTKAQSVHWSVIELSDERYVLQGNYIFRVEGGEHAGSTILDRLPYRNAWAANKAIPEHAEKQWEVWYSPKNLLYSSLQKNFPFKECVSAIILWGLLIYFIALKLYSVPNRL
jgi:hypothetical protein